MPASFAVTRFLADSYTLRLDRGGVNFLATWTILGGRGVLDARQKS